MNEPREMVAYLNGRIVPYSQALAGLSESGAESAGGHYDAERTFGGQVFKLREHLQRLYRSLDFAHLDPGMTLEEMEATTMQVVEANLPLLASGGDFIVGQIVSAAPTPPSDGPGGVNVVIRCQFIDFAAFAHGYSRGVRVVTPVTYSGPPQPSSDGAGQETLSLMMDDEGNITECRHANFMFVRDGRIKLPNRQNVLPGISMETVLELAESLEIPVDEDNYNSHDVYVADEAFVSGTRYCLQPVVTLNGLSLGQGVPGPVVGRLLAAWSEQVGVNFVQQAVDHLPARGT
jgi:branched-chain amino acid aminotransferase